MKKRLTLKEFAEACGFSAKVVTYAFTRPPRCYRNKLSKIDIVLQKAAELGFVYGTYYQHRRVWTDEKIAEIRRLKQGGMSYKEIGKLYNANSGTIAWAIRAPRGKKCEQCGATKKLHAHHLDYITNEAITLCARCHRKAHKGTFPSQARVVEPSHASKTRMELRELGYTYQAIANAHGVSRQTVYTTIKRAKDKLARNSVISGRN